MTTTKQSWFKRSLAVLLAIMMVMSLGVTKLWPVIFLNMKKSFLFLRKAAGAERIGLFSSRGENYHIDRCKRMRKIHIV